MDIDFCDKLDHLAGVWLDTINSPATKSNYKRGVYEFLSWLKTCKDVEIIDKMLIQSYMGTMMEQGVGKTSINQRLCAIRGFIQEASDNHLIDSSEADSIQRVKGIKTTGRSVGKWLSKEEATELLQKPSDTKPDENENARTAELRQYRNTAILAVMLGCGLRREEVVKLSYANLQQRGRRWMITGLKGKGNKTRDIPMAEWTKTALHQWSKKAGDIVGVGSGFRTNNPDEKIFKPVLKNGKVLRFREGNPTGITTVTLRRILKKYTKSLGWDEAGEIVAPHDLRRTYARLAYEGGAKVEQIQITLGHSSLATTERYLGIALNIDDAPCDHLGI